MKQKISTLFIILLSSLLLLPLTDPLFGCAGGDDLDYIENSSMFNPAIIDQPKYVPLFMTAQNYYGQKDADQIKPEKTKSIVIEEWKKYFNDGLDNNEINQLVFISSKETIDSLISAVKTNTVFQSGSTWYLLAEKMKIIKDADVALKYLKLAKDVEVYANTTVNWWEPVKHDSLGILPYVSICETGYKKTKSQFIKARYGFQWIRSLYLAGEYAKCIEDYEQQINTKPDAGSMYYRTLGFKAASLYKLKRYAEANLIYAKIYSEYEPGMIDAFWSFHPQEENDWQQCISLAKTTGEKETLWHLFGVYADPFEGMKQIYKINPSTKLNLLLLVRSVNIAETKFIKTEIELQHDQYYETPIADTTLLTDPMQSWKSITQKNTRDLVNFIQIVSKDPKTFNPSNWKSAAAYLHFLLNEPDSSYEWINIAEKDSTASPLVKQQNSITKALVFESTLKNITQSDEAKMENLIQDYLHFNTSDQLTENTTKYISTKLSVLYQNQNDKIKAELTEPRYHQYYIDENEILTMINFMNMNNHSAFEKLLLSRYQFKVADLYNVLAVENIYQYNFGKAIEWFEKSNKGSALEPLNANPFTIHISDCHDCDFDAPKKIQYSTYTFAKKMLDLKTAGDSLKNPEERATNYFLYANGLYNMTYYGNSRVVSLTVLSTWSEDYPIKFPHSSYTDCSEALKYYQLALSLTKDKEMQAKYAWMCAKCEHAIWLENDKEQSSDFVAGTYFTKLKNEYSNTNYFKEIINECGYFCTFMNYPNEKCIRNKN